MKAIYKFHIKRIFTNTFGFLSRKTGAPRILAFHSVENNDDTFLHQPPQLFEDQIRYLAENKYKSCRVADIAIGLSEIVLQNKIVILTFDDGIENFRTIVCPILKKYGMTATFFIPTAYIGDERQKPHHKGLSVYNEYQMLSWQDLREMASEGFEIGAHSHTHLKLSQQASACAKDEIERPKLILENKLGCPVKSFAYPFGRSDAYAPWTRDLLAEAGYTAGCTMMSRVLSKKDDLLQLPRTDISGFDTLKQFVMKLNGDYDCLRWIWNK
ncbi:MAG: polysaccharide deacetylase family protein [Desulfuromonadales bacterium]|nr:polysaccharide deacetylase family protein [Desulfuromonadales bacterium]